MKHDEILESFETYIGKKLCASCRAVPQDKSTDYQNSKSNDDEDDRKIVN